MYLHIALRHFFFFFNDPTTTEIYTLSLHDALPNSWPISAAGTTSFRPSSSSAARCTARDRKSTRLNSSHVRISYAVFCLKKKNMKYRRWKHSYSRLNNPNHSGPPSLEHHRASAECS